MRPVGNVFTAGGIGNNQTLRTTDIICIKTLKYLFDNDPDILFHNQVLLVIACLRHFSKTEDLKRFLSVWSFEKFCFFVFFVFFSGQKKGFDKTLMFHHCRIR